MLWYVLVSVYVDMVTNGVVVFQKLVVVVVDSAAFAPAAAAAPVDELILDDGSMEQVTPIAGPSSDSEAVFVPELVVDGVERFEWPLRGMDCPDCAMKATRAVTRLPGIDEVVVSATEGSVRIELDVARGRVSRVSSVLESLGNSPEVEWRLVQAF